MIQALLPNLGRAGGWIAQKAEENISREQVNERFIKQQLCLVSQDTV